MPAQPDVSGFVVIKTERTPTPTCPDDQRGARTDAALAQNQTLFLLLMGMRESSIAEVYVRGRRIE